MPIHFPLSWISTFSQLSSCQTKLVKRMSISLKIKQGMVVLGKCTKAVLKNWKKVKGSFYWALSEFHMLISISRADHFQILQIELPVRMESVVIMHSGALIKKKRGEN